jgi:hypothetical protein
MQYATKQEDDKNNYYITASMTVAVIMIAVFGCFCSCGMLMSASIISSGSANAIALAPPICTILCTGSGAFAVFGCLRWAVDFMNVKEKKLTSYTRFAQCSSDYLTIQPAAYANFELALAYIRQSSWMALGIVIMWSTFLVFGCGFFLATKR